MNKLHIKIYYNRKFAIMFHNICVRQGHRFDFGIGGDITADRHRDNLVVPVYWTCHSVSTKFYTLENHNM